MADNKKKMIIFFQMLLDIGKFFTQWRNVKIILLKKSKKKELYNNKNIKINLIIIYIRQNI